jgi:hypothetical protein
MAKDKAAGGNSEDCLNDLVSRFKRVLNGKKGILECFCRYGVQVEGWLKGEFLYFLDNEKKEGRIDDFDREVSICVVRKKVDFKVRIPTSSGVLEAWIELKHWLIGRQQGKTYNAQFYFTDPRVGIKPDAEKLCCISTGRKFFLILTTAKPGVEDWETGVYEFNRSFPSINLESLTKLENFPCHYYVGLLEVKKK